jgi:DNA invertase Pin-like site-specific DNA recombinase
VLAAIYARISRDPNHDELGVMRQEADCRALCARLGYEVAAVIVDDDRSAYSGKRRPGFDLMRSMLEQREVGVVVAWHPDRLTRHPRELEDLIDLLEAASATVHTVQAGEYDLSTPSGRMTARIVGTVARHESEHKSARLRRKHEELAAAGKVSGGGDRPFGYARDRVTLVPDEAALIREGVAWLLDGGTLTGLWRDWKRRGIDSPAGNVWTFEGLRRMFLGARIAGKRAHHGVIVADAVWPAIITLDEHLRLNAIFSQRMRTTPPRSYVLVGLLFCSTCGGRMVAQPRKGGRTYSCAPHVGGCNGRKCYADPLESLIVDAVLARLAGEPLMGLPNEIGRASWRERVC